MSVTEPAVFASEQPDDDCQERWLDAEDKPNLRATKQHCAIAKLILQGVEIPIERHPDAVSLNMSITHHGTVGRHRTPSASLLGDIDAIMYGQRELDVPRHCLLIPGPLPHGTTLMYVCTLCAVLWAARVYGSTLDASDNENDLKPLAGRHHGILAVVQSRPSPRRRQLRPDFVCPSLKPSDPVGRNARSSCLGGRFGR